MRIALVVLVIAVMSEVALARPVPLRSTVGCGESVGAVEEVPPTSAVVLDRIALPAGRYPWKIERTWDRAYPLWGKFGVLLRAGTGDAVTVSVARPWRRHARIGWGDGAALSVRFLPCESAATWLAFAGGFSLKKRGCIPFDVQAGDRIQRVRIAFGRPCS